MSSKADQTPAVNVINVTNGAIDAEDIRNTHLSHEASVQSVGISITPLLLGL